MMTQKQHISDMLSKLRSLGVKVALDDFGTGFSSLSYLSQLPIDTLKIDKSFIDGVPGSSNSIAVVLSIIDLAKHFNLEVVAEGVETKNQLKFLKENDCDIIQGFLLGKPLKAEDFPLPVD